jgi:hypothetical protein
VKPDESIINLLKQFLFAFEVKIKCTRGDTGLFNNVLDCGIGISLLCKYF